MSKHQSLKTLDKEDFLKLLAPADRDRIFSDSGLRGALGFVVFENQDKASPEFGARTVIPVGPDHTYKSVVELRGAWLGEENNRRFAVSYFLNVPEPVEIDLDEQ
jgi:hypothetical protein